MNKRYFHGGPHALTHIDPARLNDDGFLICLAASANVAQRYGVVVTEFSLNTDDLVTVNTREWAENDPRIDGTEAVVVVSGDDQSFDFPVDVLNIRRVEAVKILGVVSGADLTAIDDRLAKKEPEGPSDVGWDAYVRGVYCGDEDTALAAHDWLVRLPGHVYEFVTKLNEARRPSVDRVCSLESGRWLVEDNYGGDDYYFETRSEALWVAHSHCRQEDKERKEELVAIADGSYDEKRRRLYAAAQDASVDPDIPF